MICEANITHHGIRMPAIKPKPDYHKGLDMPFHMLIHSLIPDVRGDPREVRIKGCQIFLPETLFFENGRPIWMAYTEREQFLSKINYAGQQEATIQNTRPLHRVLQDNTITRKARNGKFWMQYAF